MAILGTGGLLELSRETPQPMALTAARLNRTASPISVSLANQGYWTGDRVVIASSRGVPIDSNNDNYADCPDGHGFYRGSVWETGPARSFYTGSNTDTSSQYKTGGNSDRWYNRSASTGQTTVFDAYIHRDELDRITFYSSEANAYDGGSTGRYDLAAVDPGNFVIAAYSSNAGFTSAMNSLATSIQGATLTESEQPADSVTALPSLFGELCSSANRQWLLQGGLEEWALNIDASNLDTTAIGETFGENVKALVRGSGTLQFEVDHRDRSTEYDSMMLMRLVLMTQNQCNTNAKFHLYKNRSESTDQVNGTAYYECDILLTNTKINTRVTDIISGTADFVATSSIKLRVATA